MHHPTDKTTIYSILLYDLFSHFLWYYSFALYLHWKWWCISSYLATSRMHNPHTQCTSPKAALAVHDGNIQYTKCSCTLTIILPALMVLPSIHYTNLIINYVLLNLWYDDQCTKTNDDHSQYSHYRWLCWKCSPWPQYSDHHTAGPNGIPTHPLYSIYYMIKAYNDRYTKSTWWNELPPEWPMSAAVLHMRNCTWEAARLLHVICITFSNGTSSGDCSSSCCISKNFLFTLDSCKPFILRHPLK